jgi:hypothetical protein
MNDDAAKSTDGKSNAVPTARRSRERCKLNDEQREYVVRRLAVYDGPTAIARDVRERFGIDISHQAIAFYDPTRVPACPKQWADLFFAVRRTFIESRAARSIRIRTLENDQRDRMVLRAAETIADRILKGGPVQGCNKPPERVTDEDRLRALIAFANALKVSNPEGYAALRAALCGDEAAGDAPAAVAQLPQDIARR